MTNGKEAVVVAYPSAVARAQTAMLRDSVDRRDVCRSGPLKKARPFR
jgi:hypothetical protein